MSDGVQSLVSFNIDSRRLDITENKQALTIDNVIPSDMDRFGVRYVTPLECERLQTVPDNYTNVVSNSQRYKMLGNGWTVDVIAHIFSGIT